MSVIHRKNPESLQCGGEGWATSRTWSLEAWHLSGFFKDKGHFNGQRWQKGRPAWGSIRKYPEATDAGQFSSSALWYSDQVILCGRGHPVHCRMFHSTPGLQPLEASNTHTHTCDTQNVSGQLRTTVDQMHSRNSLKLGLSVMNSVQGEKKENQRWKVGRGSVAQIPECQGKGEGWEVPKTLHQTQYKERELVEQWV